MILLFSLPPILLFRKLKIIIIEMTNPTIFIHRFQDCVDSACIMHELRNLGCILRVEIIRCLDMNDVYYKTAIVHFKYWYQNESTVLPRKLLKEGKTIKLTTNKMYDWQAEEYTDRVLIKEDCRPYSQRRLDDMYCDQDVAQGFADRRMKRKDDMRTYSQRRLDDLLCDEDVAQGFIDRRTKRVDYMSLPISKIADALPEEKKEPEPAEQREPEKPKLKPLIRNPEMVLRMQHSFRCEITDEIYRDNIQVVRDAMSFAKDLCEEEEEETKSKVHYDGNYPVIIKRKPRIIC